MFFDAPPSIFEKAKLLRQHLTTTETALWDELRNRKLGVKFRRQHPISLYIVDFYCHEKKLVIEVDGDYHLNSSQQNDDQVREDELQSLGLKVVRFTDEQVSMQIKKVIEQIKKELALIPPTPKGAV